GIRDFHVTGVQTCALPIYDRLDEAVLTALFDLDDLAFRAHDAALLRVLAQEACVEGRIEMKRICDVRERRVAGVDRAHEFAAPKIGRASCRERVENSVGDG